MLFTTIFCLIETKKTYCWKNRVCIFWQHVHIFLLADFSKISVRKKFMLFLCGLVTDGTNIREHRCNAAAFCVNLTNIVNFKKMIWSGEFVGDVQGWQTAREFQYIIPYFCRKHVFYRTQKEVRNFYFLDFINK